MTDTVKKKKRDIRGYSLSLTFTLFRYMVDVDIAPFRWHKPMFCYPDKEKPSMMTSWHLNVGCVHVWGTEGRGLIGFSMDVEYMGFWSEKPKCPPTYKQLF